MEEQIKERRERPSSKLVVAPDEKTNREPKAKPARKPAARSKKVAFNSRPKLDWRQFAFGFMPLPQDEKPDIKITETDKEFKAAGEDKKSFDTKEARGTRTQKAETTYIKDGKTFGVEIKSTEVIEAVSKADGKSFRKELSLAWGAEVAACPDVNGVSVGTGKAHVISKTIYTESGQTITMTTEFDLQAKLIGHVDDQAVLTDYDLQLDAYVTNSGQEDALRRNLTKEINLKDGRYGLRYDIKGSTIEVSDGTYGGYRKDAKMGKITAGYLTSMSDADTRTVAESFGRMIPSIWISANDVYKSAERNWKNYGCVEVRCRVPKTTLKPGEQIEISTETVHLQDGGKVNAQLDAAAYPGQARPESQRGTPGATFIFTQEGDENSSFSVKSISNRGIGEGEVNFHVEKEREEEAEAGTWTGTIGVERKHREERENRSGANLAENGGNAETVTNVQVQLTARRDTSVDANNAYFGLVTGQQVMVDYEYDRYKVDEGFCGPNAIPYKGPKEITRTSTTTADYNKETRVFVEIGGTGGTLTFSLPEVTGRTVHSYVHKSTCAEHDRVNTNEAISEDVATIGGSFSFSFPVDRTQKTIKGSINVREEDGSTTTYSWELTRN